jgi:hypothetical protein
MGQGLGAVLPVVVVGIVADLLVELLLHLKIVLRVEGGVVLGGGMLGRIRHDTTEHLSHILEHPGGGD